MGDAHRIHNEAMRPMIAELWRLADQKTSALNVLAESLLLAVALLNFPDSPRKQALLIQEIADGAADRAQPLRGRPAPDGAG